MNTKRKSVDYSKWDSLEKEIEEEERQEQENTVEGYWKKDHARSMFRMLGSGAEHDHAANFKDACKLVAHHFKQHPVCRTAKKIDPQVTDQQLEEAMQKCYDKARCYYAYYSHMFMESLQVITSSPVAPTKSEIEKTPEWKEYMAMMEQFKRFCAMYDNLVFIDTAKWKESYEADFFPREEARRKGIITDKVLSPPVPLHARMFQPSPLLTPIPSINQPQDHHQWSSDQAPKE